MSGPSFPLLLPFFFLAIATTPAATAHSAPVPPAFRRREGSIVDHENHGFPVPVSPHSPSSASTRQPELPEEEDNTALIAGLGGGGALLALILALAGGGSISSSIECNCNGEFGGDDDDDDDDDYDVDIDFDYDERGLPVSAVMAGAMTSALPIRPGFAARGPLDEFEVDQPQPDGWGLEMGNGGLDSAPAHLPFSNDQMEIV